MSKKVLIAYGTRYGSTEEISQEIAKMLEKEGIESQVVNLGKTKPKNWPSIDEFDGVLVGSGIKVTRWVKHPKTFLQKHKDDIKTKGKILGIFISSGFAASPEKQPEAKKLFIEDLLEKFNIEADIYDAFGGIFDFSESSKMGFIDKKALQLAAKGMSEDFGLEYDPDGRNDFRDWDQIRSFTEKFAALLKS
ncbi:MAG: flavodoxin domain-containing protein [Promethearchaeota archaeon]